MSEPHRIYKIIEHDTITEIVFQDRTAIYVDSQSVVVQAPRGLELSYHEHATLGVTHAERPGGDHHILRRVGKDVVPDEDEDPIAIVHTTCARCGLDIEGPLNEDGTLYHDRGGNVKCPNYHELYHLPRS